MPQTARTRRRTEITAIDYHLWATAGCLPPLPLTCNATPFNINRARRYRRPVTCRRGPDFWLWLPLSDVAWPLPSLLELIEQVTKDNKKLKNNDPVKKESEYESNQADAMEEEEEQVEEEDQEK